MIRLPGDPLLETRLTQLIEARLRARRHASRDHAKSLERVLAHPVTLTRSERVKFRILHRQFSGGWVPGLPTAVQTGRLIVQTWRRLRRQT